MTIKNLVHNKLRLFTSSDAYTFEPINDNPGGFKKCLTIDRITRDIKLVDSPKETHQHVDSVITVYGLLGIINLASTQFVIVISDREYCGSIKSNEIYRATDFKMYPIDKTSTLSSVLQHPVDGALLGLLKNHFNDGNFYFSSSYDVTSSVQRRANQTNDTPLFENSDNRFFWNKFLQKPLIEASNSNQDLSNFILPVIFGFLEIRETSIYGQPITFSLIARRSRFRAGTRYFSRGIDQHGNVSNFNETEQIIVAKSDIYSHVQCRGSVPIFWSEINNLRYKPDLQIMDVPQSMEALRLHLSSLVQSYGSVLCVNLVNQKGYEKPVKDWFEAALNKLKHPKVDYEYFDFHAECSKMRWHRIQLLLDKLNDNILSQGYYHEDSQGNQKRNQTSIFRTNCMDCLDRTNVVQSAVAKDILTLQLKEAGIIGAEDTINEDVGFIYLFRNVWADHADAVSVTYSGTGALKTDFTRTGRRTIEGALSDLVNSITRYVKNNYFDGARQDAFDLVLGAWTPTPGVSINQDNRSLITRAAPYVLTYSLLMIISGVVLPSNRNKSLATFYFIFTNVIALTSIFIIKNGIQYVSWPKLNRIDNVIHYEGPGFKSPLHGRGFTFAQPPRLYNKRIEEIELGAPSIEKKRSD